MAKAMLRLDSIVKDYKVADTYVHALKGVSLSFRKNEFVSILGQSGCGKTTLLNIIGGLDKYTSGDLIIRGKSTKDYNDKDWDAYRNHSIGFVFQTYNLIPHQTVLGNVELALTLSGISSVERKERAKQALIRVGLEEQIYKKPNQLSGGQMQRVAIARALVNDPEILLADEPTGALDSETSVQIMDLIKEIAGERLVIMVTHNPELAEQYSTRIVRLSDGLVVGDTNPFIEDETQEDNQEDNQEAIETIQETDKKAKKKKTSMSFFTAFCLSGRNLLTKRGRTFITSIAGSIGIIGVCLVLALSSGFSGYISRTEEDMLSAYPIEITETTMDYDTIMENMVSGMQKPDPNRLKDKVYVNSFLTKLADGMTVKNNITKEYVEHIEQLSPDVYGAIQYSYGMSLTYNVYTEAKIGNVSTINSLSNIYDYYTWLLNTAGAQAGYGSMSFLLATLGSVISKMPGTDDLNSNRYGDYVLSQYDKLAGRFPEKENEIILVIDSKNEITDLVLAQLGLISQDEFLGLFDESEDKEELSIDFNDVLEKKFTLYYNDTVFKENTVSGDYAFTYENTRKNLDVTNGEGLELDIVGIYKPKEDMNYGCLSTGLNVTEALVNKLRANSLNSKLIKWYNEYTSSGNFEVPVKTNKHIAESPKYYQNSEDFEKAKRSFGGNDLPIAIYIYGTEFDGKNQILSHLDAWNEEQAKLGKDGNEIKYMDTVGIMMTMVQTMLDAITYVLVAFTSISLVVSSVMIGVITYVSVVERTKEIGVLRSIGARKKDIKHVFNAETFIIGLCAGLLGVIVSYLLCLIVNLILTPLTGIANLAHLPLYQAGIMIVISIILTLVSGLIPASAAAKKDPVIALRTE